MTVRAIRQLLTTLIATVGMTALAALIYWQVSGDPFPRAARLVFYVGGAATIVFGALTNGAERRAYGMAPVGLLRYMRVAPEERVLNPTGVIVLCGIVVLVIGGVLDSVL